MKKTIAIDIDEVLADSTELIRTIANKHTALTLKKSDFQVPGPYWNYTEHCISASEYQVEAILFGEFGWHLDVPNNMQRCKDWPAVLEYFNGRA